MTDAAKLQLTIDFGDPTGDPQKQEQQTRSLFKQLKDIDGITVERIADPNPEAGSRSIGGFIWGVLTTKLTWDMVKPVLGRVLDVTTGKNKPPIKVKAKQNGREVEIEVGDRQDLEAVSQFLHQWSQSAPDVLTATIETLEAIPGTTDPKQIAPGE